jgi:hypothetical protein
MGKYQLPYSHPNRSHRGLWALYNHIWPELAKALDIPARNLKLSCWSSEKGTFTIKISNPKTDIEMVELMAPKALKALFEKDGFTNVKTSHVCSVSSKETAKGNSFPMVEIDFTTDYPALWIKYDEQRFGPDLAKVVA